MPLVLRPLGDPLVTVALRLGSWAELGDEAYRIRHAVFVVEQGVPVELEQDEHDASALHVLLMVGGQAVATGRLLGDGHIGRLAVLAACRGQGYGQRVMCALMEEAIRRGHSTLILNAQTSAQAFYEALGFELEGEVFMEAGIAHIEMRKSVGGSSNAI